MQSFLSSLYVRLYPNCLLKSRLSGRSDGILATVSNTLGVQEIPVARKNRL